jgi:hypothetical protein
MKSLVQYLRGLRRPWRKCPTEDFLDYLRRRAALVQIGSSWLTGSQEDLPGEVIHLELAVVSFGFWGPRKEVYALISSKALRPDWDRAAVAWWDRLGVSHDELITLAIKIGRIAQREAERLLKTAKREGIAETLQDPRAWQPFLRPQVAGNAPLTENREEANARE